MKRQFIAMLPYALILIGILIALIMISENSSRSTENNGYVRVINCIIFKGNSQTRTRDDIEDCYRAVENDLHITLDRYDK